MEKFASYGFNKSHAAAYGYLSYVTAYLKANYPTEWMAALMTCDRDDLTKVAKFIREAKAWAFQFFLLISMKRRPLLRLLPRHSLCNDGN